MLQVKNRKCIRKLSFKTLQAARKRNLIAIIAIVLTTLLFTSLFTIVMSMNSSYQTYTFRQIGGYSHGTFKEVTDEQAEAIAGHDKVKSVGKRKVIGMTYDGVFAKVPAEISYMDENCTKWSYAQPTTGDMPKNGNEIAMDTGVLKLLGIAPELGAEITLTYTVGVGDKNQVTYEKTDTFTLVGYWEYDNLSPVHYINISEEYANDVEREGIAAGMDAFLNDLDVMMKSGIDIRGQMEQVDTDLGYSWEDNSEGNLVRIGVNWGYTTAQLDAGMDVSTIMAVIVFLLLVIFTGYLIIYNVFQISVSGDIRFYGLLKTIGVTPRQLRRIIRQQALLLCIIGIPAGLFLGYMLGAVLTPVVLQRTSLGAISATLSTSPLIFIVSTLFALVTVLLSCARPGRMAAKVSPVEATKYTEVILTKKKKRSTRGAKVYQMAFANLGRNKLKTTLVILSLALTVGLFNLLVIFVNGFDMEKYLEKFTCADFIVSETGYFRYQHGLEEYISEETIAEIERNTLQSMDGCGYTLNGYYPQCWMAEEEWRTKAQEFYPIVADEIEQMLFLKERRGDLVAENVLIEGFDKDLFDKVTVVEGDLNAVLAEDSHSFALVAEVDDYGNVTGTEYLPPLGEEFVITYIDEAYYTDSRTGEKCDENTPDEFLEFYIAKSHDVTYTIGAYVIVPHAMSFRYGTFGYNAVLPVDKLEKDSGKLPIPMFYLFDTPDHIAEAEAEQYLAELTEGDSAGLMYESKALVREEFKGFQNMFLLLGGLLCAIIGMVGILNYLNAIMTGILARKREFAVLQSVGMTNRQLKSMLVCEGMFYALGAAILALGISVVLNPLLGNLLESILWFFRARFTIIAVLLAIPVFALLGWLVPAIMYGQTMKYSVVERLREVE